MHNEIDRGPPGFHFVIEIHLTDRMFTLYTDSKMQQDQFFDYLTQVLQFKAQIQESQKQYDSQMQKKMQKETKLIQNQTKTYIQEVGGNLKNGYCYNEHAKRYH